MKDLIEYPILREINIIQTLFLKDEPLHEKEIALLNDCSLSTVRTDMAKIEKEYSEIFKVRIENASIYFLKKNTADISLVLLSLYSESLNLQLIFELFDNPFQSRYHYAQALAISESSFYRAIRNINTVLDSAGFKIEYQNEGYFLQANKEEDLRRFIVAMYLQTKSLEEGFTRIPFKIMNAIVGEYILNDIPSDFILFNKSCIYLFYISLIRETQGFNTALKIEDFNYPEYDKLKIYFPDLKQEHLFSIREIHRQQMEPWENKQEKKKILKVLQTFIDDVESLYQTSFNNTLRERLLLAAIVTYGGFEFYSTDYKITLNRVDYCVFRFKNLETDAYDGFYKILEKANKALGQEPGHNCHQMLAWFNILWPNSFEINRLARVKIFSDLGLEHQAHYKKIFADLFSDVKILDDDDPQVPDFIIANHPLQDQDAPLLFIQDFPLYENVLKIHRDMFEAIEK